MAISELVSFVLNLLPFLNASVIVLTIDLGLTRLGFKITKTQYKRRPWRSLLWGLGLILLSGLISLMVQRELSGFQPFVVFIVLLASYLVLTQT